MSKSLTITPINIDSILEYLKPYCTQKGCFTKNLIDVALWEWTNRFVLEFDIQSNFPNKSNVRRYLINRGFEYTGIGVLSLEVDSEIDRLKIEDFINFIESYNNTVTIKTR
jgi:hypothetical protein